MNSRVFIDVSVDCVIFGFTDEQLQVLLIEHKYKDADGHNKTRFALPGDLVYIDENLDVAAKRVLKELTSLDDVFMKQFYTFGDPNRVKGKQDREWLEAIRVNPDARVITVAYYSLVKMEEYIPQPSSFASNTVWMAVDQLPDLAFDHNDILNKGLTMLRDQLETHPVSFELLPKKFTLSQLQQLHEIILNTKLDKRNFRRKIQKMNSLIPLDEKQKGVLHKPARLFTYEKNGQ